jgi:plasmid maintenance system killer protein
MNPPGPLSLHGNVADNWRKWKQRFELYLTASGNDTKGEEIKSAILLHAVGEEALEIYNTFTWDAAGDERRTNTILEKFTSYCEPKKNLTWERHVFNTRNQQADETIDKYVTDLKIKAMSCEFGVLKDSLIRDRIVCGIQDKQTRRQLLKEPNLTLSQAIDICRASETTKSQLKFFDSEPPDTIPYTEDHEINVMKRREYTACSKCGKDHLPHQRCPAAGAQCHKCGKMNHFARVCRSQLPIPRGNKRVQVVEEESDNEDDLKIYTVTSKHKSQKDWNISVKVNGKNNIKFKIDTGAQCNIMSLRTYNAISNQPLKRSRSKLVTFGGHKITPKGKTQIVCEHKNRLTVVEFEVVNEGQNILGLKSSIDMKLVKRIDTITNSTDTLLAQYEDVFKGLGCITKVQHSIKTNPNYRPVIHPPRRVPAALRKKVRQELDRMEKLGVIKRIHTPTKWVNSMVVAIKPNGKLRICLDPRDLNQAILREHYPMPTIEDVLTRIPKAKVFSVLDATSGYWQIELDEESTELCTFNTPFGRYAFKRLPFGISSSQDIFQAVMTDLFNDIEGVEVIVDDIPIWARNEEDHNKILRKVLD